MNVKLHHSDCIEVLKNLNENSIDSLVTDPPAGISFMNKEWDHHKGGRDEWIKWMTSIMKECLRVLKPGAHGLVWALPRTSHWTATALENAGFEVRDVIMHLFGTGFPKSLDVSKAIDKEAGMKRKVVGYDASKARPNKEGYAKVTSSIKTKGNEGHKDNGATITAPATDNAKKWQGYGTALKPAVEEWILVRKPLSEKTVAKNVLKWGTGGLNIDRCRIGTEEKLQSGRHIQKNREYPPGYKDVNRTEFVQSPQGRFPANFVLSCSPHCTDDQHDIECAIKMMNEQSGTLVSKWGKQKTKHSGESSMFGLGVPDDVNKFSGDSGGASRFFYVAKASKSERGENNNHPTVKSLKLMQYLIKLITPPNGTVLDPFMGSGSTGVAAKNLRFKFIGIEKEKEYFEIAKTRIK